jgi:hypothetical protein
VIHRALISYHYMRQAPSLPAYLAHHLPGREVELFVDSGAFTALQTGKPISVDDYGAWLAQDASPAAVIANLDVIGHDAASAEATWANHRVLEDRYGLSVLPVVHIGEPWDALDRYLDSGHDYIALGGLVGRSWKVAAPWVLGAFRRASSRAVFHGFGLTRHEALADLPWYSVDSSSWGEGYRYGSVRLFDPRSRRLRLFRVSDRAATPNSSRTREFNRLARLHGMRPEDLRSPGAGSLDAVAGVAARAWRLYEHSLIQRHGAVVRPRHPHSPHGFRLYLADSAGHLHRRAVAALATFTPPTARSTQ